MDKVVFARYSGETAKIIFAPLFIGLARGYFADVEIEVIDLDFREVADNRGSLAWCTRLAERTRKLAREVVDQGVADARSG